MDHDIQLSARSFDFPSEQGLLRIRIYRTRSSDGWLLAVLTEEGLITAWRKGFPTEIEAYNQFLSYFGRHGPDTFFDEGLPREINH